ncbi:MAG: FUSC family protein [Syntrophobacterales bacterium]
MIPLSTRSKESIKTALAMTIAYGIALYMDWEKPHWAGIAVAMISLSTVGQSLNKGAMRMLGTLVAATAALIFLALFFQARWWMMLGLSLYVGFCTYMLTGKKYQYAWFVSGFVCLVIGVNAGTSAEQAFQIAVERTQETGMGILVYSLISIFLWPQRSVGAFNNATRKLLATQAQLYRVYLGLITGKGTAEQSQPLRLQQGQLLSQVGQLLIAAEADTYEVWEVRHQWHRFHGQSTVLMEVLERWRQSFAEIQKLNLTRLMPNLESLGSEIDLRFRQIERMLAGEKPDHMPQVVTLKIDKAETISLSHFQKAAVAVTRTQLDRLEALSRSLFDCIRDIRGYGPQVSMVHRGERPSSGLAIDLDRLGAAIMVMATLWIAFLIWVYIDPPGHNIFVQLTTTFAMAAAMMPQVPVSTMLLPFGLGSIFAGVIYIFIMPHLSGYAELGVLIFAVTFAIYYLFWEPRQILAKMGGIVTFIVLISVQNQQTYSFAKYANSAAMFMLGIALVVATAYIPTSPRPEKKFLRLLRRFFRHAELLMSRMALDSKKQGGWVERWKMMLFQNDLLELPQKLAVFGGQIDRRFFPGTTSEQVQTLVNSLRALALRLKDLVGAGGRPQAEPLVRELLEDVRGWRQAIEVVFRVWAGKLSAESAGKLEKRLEEKLSTMESRINETFNRIEPDKLKDEDYVNFYRLLGSYRGLSEALVGYVQLAQGINWMQWEEARF